MKKMFSLFVIVAALAMVSTANAADGLMKRKAEAISKKLSSYSPEGVLYGPGWASYSPTSLVSLTWSGDPLPAGAYYYIDDYNIEYQSAGRTGSEFGSLDIPMSVFGGPGTYQIGIVYWLGPAGYMYVPPITVTLL